MGKITKQNIISSSLNIIDYSSLNNCDDLLDVWLFANCLFCITTGSGPDMISDVYKRPLLCLNYIPITHLFSWSYAVHVPKKLYHKNGGKMLSWSDYLRYNFGTSSIEYEEADIKIVDLSSDEILESVKEMLERVKGVWVDSKRDIKMHNRFWSMALKDKNYIKKYSLKNRMRLIRCFKALILILTTGKLIRSTRLRILSLNQANL